MSPDKSLQSRQLKVDERLDRMTRNVGAVASDELPLHQTHSGLRGDWIAACLVGELAGFLPPALTGALLYWAEAPEVVLVVGLVLAGCAEGAILGAFQARVIDRASASQLRWSIRLAGSCRRRSHGSSGDDPAVIALSVVPNGAHLGVHIAVGMAAAVAMGATVGVITGSQLTRFATTPDKGQDHGS